MISMQDMTTIVILVEVLLVHEIQLRDVKSGLSALVNDAVGGESKLASMVNVAICFSRQHYAHAQNFFGSFPA
jgi:hypothetical protein